MSGSHTQAFPEHGRANALIRKLFHGRISEFCKQSTYHWKRCGKSILLSCEAHLSKIIIAQSWRKIRHGAPAHNDVMPLSFTNTPYVSFIVPNFVRSMSPCMQDLKVSGG